MSRIVLLKRQRTTGQGFKEVRDLVLGWVGGDRMVSHSPKVGFYIVSRGCDRDKGHEVTIG